MVIHFTAFDNSYKGAQWLSCRVLDLRLWGRGFMPHGRFRIVSLSKTLLFLLLQHRKTHPKITERLLAGM